MSIREQIVTEAREYLGTKFQHQARLKGVCVDCVGLVAGVSKELGLTTEADDSTRYPRRPNGRLVAGLVRAGFREIEVAEATPGDLLVFWILPTSRKPQHLGIKTPYGMIHTDAEAGKVVEVLLVGTWVERLCGAYAFPGVE